MRAQPPKEYQDDLKKAEQQALAKAWCVVISDSRVQIFSTKSGVVSVKVHGGKFKWLYRAFLRYLKNREGLEKSWKGKVGMISYKPKKATG